MTEDVSLDAFASAESDESESGTESEDADGAETESEDADEAETETDDTTAPADSEIEPAVSTYAWSPEGGECDDCGASAERRWRDDGRLVCPDCKEW